MTHLTNNLISNLKEGKGLWEQLQPEYKREYVVYTDLKGAELFDQSVKQVAHFMLVAQAKQDLNKIYLANKIDKQQHDRLMQMLDSPDMGDGTLAMEIINVKSGI